MAAYLPPPLNALHSLIRPHKAEGDANARGTRRDPENKLTALVSIDPIIGASLVHSMCSSSPYRRGLPMRPHRARS